MPLKLGTRIGLYEITGPLGKGGMGEVYRAKDTKLDREIAVKVLPNSLARDHDRLARFEREAKVLASLNHPNIATIYSLEESPEGQAIAMELVDGTTLQSPQPLDTALNYAKQIAEALEAAHDKGITHRDLKPANIMITPGGLVKVLDFGLAAVARPDAGQGADSPTLTLGMTEAGMIMGTAAYMAPEQATGSPVDKRADIWSFGVVLWQMLTGKHLFSGDTTAHILAHVITKSIDFAALPDTTPAPIRELLKRCLDRDVRTRLQVISEARITIQKYLADPKSATDAPAQTAGLPHQTHKLPWALAGVLGIVALGAVVWAMRAPSASGTTRLGSASLIMDLTPVETLGLPGQNASGRTLFAISPDGSTVIFVGAVDGKSMLYRRPIAEAAATAIAGTEGAEYPFFSPDGLWVGFAAQARPTERKLRKVALSGGPPIDLCALNGRPWGASWGSAGVIVFGDSGSLRTVSDSGGTPATLVERSQSALISPAMLPDGQTVLFTVQPSSYNWEEAHVDSIHIATKQRKTLLTNAMDARYSPTGHLVFMRNAALLAVAFDAAQVEVSGSPIPLLAGILQAVNAGNSANETGMGQFSLSGSGTLLYASGGIYPTPVSSLVRVDRTGKETKLADVKGSLYGLRVSPDGSRVVAYKTNDGSRAVDLWSYELPSGSATRLTSTGESLFPLFSPDGKSITYYLDRKNPGIYSLPTDGGSTPNLIAAQGKDERVMWPASWSPDGKWLAYLQSVGNVRQLFVRPMQPPGEAKAFAASTFNVQDAGFSPDGRWIAYRSNESGADEVYVQAFPGPGAKHPISLRGGTNPAWSRNGRELFYLQSVPASNTRTVNAVEISSQDGSRVGAPRVLFEGPYQSSTPLRSYDMTSDGQFIMMRVGEEPDQKVTKLNVVLGWAEELKRRVPSSTPAR
ncbi:MAG: protein kinase [Acidobacteriota bacterium]